MTLKGNIKEIELQIASILAYYGKKATVKEVIENEAKNVDLQ